MSKIEEYLHGVKKIAIAGHVSPDGDCTGACLGLWIYLNDNYPEIEADVYLQEFPKKFGFLKGSDKTKPQCSKEDGKKYDLLVLLDISSKDRIGVAGALLESVDVQLCVDHHITNTGGFTYFNNDPNASSASEVLFRMLDSEKISKECAEALYMGIVHDTGVFRYSSTSPETMRIAADLMEKGIDYSRIIDDTFYQKTMLQHKLTGIVLDRVEEYLDGIFVAAALTQKDKDELGFKVKDLDGIVAALRDTQGVDVSVLIYELETGECKVSLRSKKEIDVSAVASYFGGGGHVRAAGFKVKKSTDEIISELVEQIGKQLS